jgi:pyruvate kinase
MRLGHFADRQVRHGERVRFSLLRDEDAVPLTHREIFGSITIGETLSCDDDRLRFRVESVRSEMLETVSLSDGFLLPRKGINVLEHPVTLNDLSEFDLRCIQAAGQANFAFSFMKDGSESQWIRRRAPGCAVIGKIERGEAIDNIHAIVRAVDSVWVCRGDLGAQLGPAALARWVSAYDPRIEPCSVLMAGQVLEHLTSHAEATRSEVCHLFDLVRRGYSGFVLSDETAIGIDPVRTVTTLRSLLAGFL